MMVAGIDYSSLSYGTFIEDEGGYYGGRMNYGGVQYALIVSPKTAETTRAFKTSNTSTSGSSSNADGLANSIAMDSTLHPAARYCRSYSGGGFSDWYLPARDELEVLYRNLKPSDTNNFGGARSDGLVQGYNSSSDPAGGGYLTNNPARTTAPEFISGEAQAFAGNGLYYWSSTQDDAQFAWYQRFNNGQQITAGKGVTSSVRPVRRVLI